MTWSLEAISIAPAAECLDIAQWNGAAWLPLGAGVSNDVLSLVALPSGDVVAGGGFTFAGGAPASFVARWNGVEWSPLGTGMDSTVRSLAVLPGGDIVAGGSFTLAGAVEANHVARWNGSEWSSLGTGMGSIGVGLPSVNALAVLSGSDVVAGGRFTTAGGVLAPYIARWGCPALDCYADCDQSGSLDIDDFICFQTLFALSDPSADCDGDTAFTIDDFICFQTFFAVGCG